MLPSRAAQSNREVGFPLLFIEGQKIGDQIKQAAQKGLRWFRREHIVSDLRMLTRHGPQIFDKVWVGEEADIKYQIGVIRKPVLVAEGNDGYRGGPLAIPSSVACGQ